ncbi:hypothetical protein AVEN_3979-1 [Araneus ventricosus]|uniref:Uncharacterized protein n=1 Tax=Araneus ventricosus TaxID=182803 RepID=A0A4Y2LLG4_ARAVE|nr:hypothetical protein AVEN_3979-1 [Araneus ventricosus]
MSASSAFVYSPILQPQQPNLNCRSAPIKRAIHRWSILEFLEHGKVKSIIKDENLRYLEQIIGSGGIPTNSKSKTSSADSNLGPRWEGSDKTKDLPTFGLRILEMKLEFPRVG